MKPNEKHGNTWTPEEENRLLKLAADSMPVDAVAEQLGRSTTAIVSKLEQIIALRDKWRTLCKQAKTHE